MPSVIILSVIILSVIILSVIMLNVVAPIFVCPKQVIMQSGSCYFSGADYIKKIYSRYLQMAHISLSI